MTQYKLLKAISAWGDQGNEVFGVIDPGKFGGVERLPPPKPFEDTVVVSGWCLVHQLELLIIQEERN
jgi:hypothetical protein